MPSSRHHSVTAYGMHCEFRTYIVQCITGIGIFFSVKDSESLNTALFVYSLIKDPYLEERTEK
jgi:hypothetical protein